MIRLLTGRNQGNRLLGKAAMGRPLCQQRLLGRQKRMIFKFKRLVLS